MYWLSVPAVVSLWPWPHLCTMDRIRTSQGQGQKIREERIVCLFRRSSCGLSSYVVDDDDRSRCAFPLDFRDAILFG